MSSVRRAEPADVPRVVEALASAFAEDPPLMWMLGTSARRRRKILRRWFGATVPRVYMRKGEVWISEAPAGAAAWVGPGTWPFSTGELAAVLPLTLWTFGRHPLRALGGVKVIDGGHPHDSHWFLDYIGVEPAGHGSGAGSALLSAKLELLDQGGEPAYLNAGSPRSRDLYVRHGFEVTEEFRLPRGGPPLWRMWRDPG